MPKNRNKNKHYYNHSNNYNQNILQPNFSNYYRYLFGNNPNPEHMIDANNYSDNEEEPPQVPPEEPVLDEPQTLIISRENLYRDWSQDNSYYTYCGEQDEPDEHMEPSTSWTDGFWKKDDGNSTEFEQAAQTQRGIARERSKSIQNKLEKQLNAMLAKPVDMSKGKSLMMKMGWQGGGLGKDGSGITEPIVPKAKYATTTMGLGQMLQKPKGRQKQTNIQPDMQSYIPPLIPPWIPLQNNSLPSLMQLQFENFKATIMDSNYQPPQHTQTNMQQNKKIKKQKGKRKLPDNFYLPKTFNQDKDEAFTDAFHTNALIHILEFVKNDSEIEITFDSYLNPNERKRIHNIVDAVSHCEDSLRYDIGYDNMEQMQLVEDIMEHNKYTLCTQSNGSKKNRRLSVYKWAPSHIYLVTPDDLIEEVEDEVYIDICQEDDDDQNKLLDSDSNKCDLSNFIDDKNCGETQTNSNTNSDENKNSIDSKLSEEMQTKNNCDISNEKPINIDTKANDGTIYIDDEITIVDEETQDVNINEKTASIINEGNTGNINESDPGNITEGSTSSNNGGNTSNMNEEDSGNNTEGSTSNNNGGNTNNTSEGNAGSITEGNASNITEGYPINITEKNANINSKICDGTNIDTNVKSDNATVDNQVKDKIEPVTLDSADKTETIDSKKDALDILINYFISFKKKIKYKEFRFLGPFSDEVKRYIDDFFGIIQNEIEHEKGKKLLEALQSDRYTFNVIFDNNGSRLISKQVKDN